MNYRSVFFMMVSLVVLAMISTGCAGTSKQSTFYLLSSLPEAGQSTQAASDQAASVLVGPITLPAYLDRDQVVTVSGHHELLVDEYTRWAEPVEDNFYRVLVENLSLLIDTPAVFSYDRRGNMATDFRVLVDVTRFDCSTDGQTYLTAFWTVSGNGDEADLVQRKSVIRITASTQDTKGKIDGQNQALTQFSREIAAAIESLKR